MKIVAILGGLGSQMTKYAFYLYIKKHTKDMCYIDTSFFSLNSSWNGYELHDVFNICEPDVSDLVERSSDHWYPGDTLSFMAKKTGKKCLYINRGVPCSWPALICSSKYLLKIYRKIALYVQNKIIEKNNSFLEKTGGGDLYWMDSIYSAEDSNLFFDEFDHRSDRYFCNMQDELKNIFKFPSLDEKNQAIANTMMRQSSVALHVRRSDHMYDNKELYKREYFKNAVSLIKKRGGERLYFYLFSDDISWCMNNLNQIGLNEHDDIIPVDWNKGRESYKDMQLMTFCQHNIIPISSFSWWGAYLSRRKDKITVAPLGHGMNMQYHF